MPSINDIEYNNANIKKEIKRIPHPKKVKKGEEKMILNYRLEEVCGYGKNNLHIAYNRILYPIITLTLTFTFTFIVSL